MVVTWIEYNRLLWGKMKTDVNILGIGLGNGLVTKVLGESKVLFF